MRKDWRSGQSRKDGKWVQRLGIHSKQCSMVGRAAFAIAVLKDKSEVDGFNYLTLVVFQWSLAIIAAVLGLSASMLAGEVLTFGQRGAAKWLASGFFIVQALVACGFLEAFNIAVYLSCSSLVESNRRRLPSL
ncbi:hypothetical protein [Rhizobium leguminosarum]|uniref:hypothetical protein n=1 Tax=Rhizobium leguminosarum TaxID=384 RepID=UPI0014413A1B|nr:hypothetical protein [Rhizobium leguminosarum]NKK80166.1 hypothetical protein [Rhizobium leguminosarum bv. viciae]